MGQLQLQKYANFPMWGLRNWDYGDEFLQQMGLKKRRKSNLEQGMRVEGKKKKVPLVVDTEGNAGWVYSKGWRPSIKNFGYEKLDIAGLSMGESSL